MAYEIAKDERKIEYKEGKFNINIEQVQLADPTNYITMVEAWTDKLANPEKFVETEAEVFESAKNRMKLEHLQTIEKVKKEIENLKTSIESFAPALEKFKTDFPEEYKTEMEKVEELKKKKPQ